MKRKFLSRVLLILSLFMVNILVLDNYEDKNIVVAEGFSGWKEEDNQKYFYQNGKKYTGKYQDKYFVNGKYANGIYEGILYKNGVEQKGKVYVNNIFYDPDGKPANGWYDDGTAWYFFQDGKKHTGKAVDANGEMYFINGKYANGYIDKLFYKDGKLADWWCDDGTAWYFFQGGKKHNGIGKDANGIRLFVNGKYANGIYNDKLYKDGVESNGKIYVNGIFYGYDKKPANAWYDDGTGWYFFKDGKKLTGKGIDANGEMYFVKGKYANGYVDKLFYKDGKLADWWCDDGTACYFFQGGKKHNGNGKDANGIRYFVNGKYANAYIDEIFYKDGKLADWWCDDGTAWYFFQGGKKHNGNGKDANGIRYFVNGKYANGIYDDKLYKDGVESDGKTYVNGIFYGYDKKPANWWYDDGEGWYFFKDGKKYTGKAVDGNGEMYFVKGKYANCYIDGLFYKDGVIANWWCDDGTAWYFFQNGIKHNGLGKDANGTRLFVGGKYANGRYNEKLYKDGLESAGNTYINGLYYAEDKYLANGWYDDGTAWYFFKDGRKHTGKAVDGNGEMYFINGKYANDYVGGIYYSEGKIADWWCDDGTAWYFFKNGKKLTGFGEDANGRRYFVKGKYANGRYNGKLYKDGLESEGNTYINGLYFGGDKYLANGWYDDGYDWYFFRDGRKHNGYATDGNGSRYFVNGKYANGYYGGKSYIDGVEVGLADSDWYVSNGIWRSKNTGRSCHVNGNFIVVSLSDQKLWLVRNGTIISKVGIVSGKPSTPTVTGIFSVLSKEYSRILKGPGYASWVQYWMPFHGSYGIHDANWQPGYAFSDYYYYRRGGSHGCINVYPGSMGYIYNNSYIGMRVIVY